MDIVRFPICSACEFTSKLYKAWRFLGQFFFQYDVVYHSVFAQITFFVFFLSTYIRPAIRVFESRFEHYFSPLLVSVKAKMCGFFGHSFRSRSCNAS